MKNATPFNSKIYNHIVSTFKLKHCETRVFFRLIGLLLEKKDPILYTNKSLAKKEQYSIRTILRALNRLEELLLITRIGCGYARRFTKGQKLIEICSELNNSPVQTTMAYKISESCENYTNTPIDLVPVPNRHPVELKEENINTTTVVAVAHNKNINSPQKSSGSFQYESKLRLAYRSNPFTDINIKTEDDFIEYCHWSIEHDRPENVKKAGRVKMIIKFLEQNELEISEKWRRKKQHTKSVHHSAYQEYAGGIKHQIKYGILPEKTKILTYDEWLETQTISNGVFTYG